MADTPSAQSERQKLMAALKTHYLAGIVCSHERGMDLPMCACSGVDLGWHPNVGTAVDAWIAHFTEALDGR